MTNRSSFSDAEWTTLGDAPLAACAAVALAEIGGGRQEADAILRGWHAAARRHAEHELIRIIADDLDPEARDSPPAEGAAPADEPDFDAVCDEAVALCARAVALLEARATPEEAAAYKAFVLDLAQRVADSAGGGPMGFGSDRVSRAERSVLREIAAALGSEG